MTAERSDGVMMQLGFLTNSDIVLEISPVRLAAERAWMYDM